MGNFVAIDGSLLAFRASAAGEKRTIVVTHRKTGKAKPFAHRTAFKEFITETNVTRTEARLLPFHITDFEIEDKIEAPPVEQAYKNVKSILSYILKACDASAYEVYLDEGLTFRHHLATVQQYKGNRLGKQKPLNLQAVKDYMVLYHKAKVITDVEADDVLNYWQWKGRRVGEGSKDKKYIAATFDKDAFGNEGWVFDFRKDSSGVPLMARPLYVHGLGGLKENANKDIKGVGRKFFYFQWLCEDTADNYKANKLAGVRFGKKAAYHYLKDLKTDRECIQAVAAKFKEWYPEPLAYTTWDNLEIEGDWISLSQEYFDLARMRRWDGDILDVEEFYIKHGVETTGGRK